MKEKVLLYFDVLDQDVPRIWVPPSSDFPVLIISNQLLLTQ